MQNLALLGDEAVALGSIHAGLAAAYGYPGTPSTEIMEYLIAEHTRGGPLARWCTNEKTALEAALGTSFAGKRALVTMKHVGLNVAADPLVNAALLSISGGLVIVVADDPGMHSSQNEQDSRFYAEFAQIPCLEPRNQQEAYDMAKDAFGLSENFRVPVMLRLTTRLCHARAVVTPRTPAQGNPLKKVVDTSEWSLIPLYAKRGYARLVEKQSLLQGAVEKFSSLDMDAKDPTAVVLTAGLGGNYYEENLPDFTAATKERLPIHLHVGAYPLPVALLHKACEQALSVLVIEEGQPFIETRLRGVLPQNIRVRGKADATLPPTGELDPEVVRKGLGLPVRENILSKHSIQVPPLPPRPPQLCQGCPHGDSFATIKKALEDLAPEETSLNGDIGCYSLGVLPPQKLLESIVCMGASVSMARGAAEAGMTYAIGIIGDSTFLHSGIPGLIDAVVSNTPMTLIILDNSTTAMTGCQDTIIPSEKLRGLLLGIGVPGEHLLELEPRKQLLNVNAARLKTELFYRGLSVVVFKRECLEAARKRKAAAST